MSVGELRQLVLDAGERALYVLLRVDREGGLKVARYAVVVDNEAGLLAQLRPVYTRDRLQQLVPAHRAVEVEHLLYWRIEACEQHALHADEGELVVLEWL